MTRKQIILATLSAGLLALGTHAWVMATAPPNVLAMIGFGVALAVVAIVYGGKLPEVLVNMGEPSTSKVLITTTTGLAPRLPMSNGSRFLPPITRPGSSSAATGGFLGTRPSCPP